MEEHMFKMLDSVKGFLDEAEGRALYDTALKASLNGPCLEIGSYCGKSAVYLGLACRRKGGVLFSVDHHRGSEEQQPGEEYFDPALYDYNVFAVDTLGAFRQTVSKAELEDTVIPLVCRSATAARKWSTALSLVFIDGGHAFDTVIADYRAWSPHLIEGGYLLIHDIFENPTEGGQAPYQVYRMALDSGGYKEELRVKTLGILKKITKQ
ncbi:MAG: class I SAM-dependent methyltransferase [Deltaproteobacteria bacterium]|jgi:predicted O-methyltransferase YrrM|nr:class I SAM-dependent methyltransferase [Deltaproteobacteria bacterium]